jgi:HAD superfamily hydrolase (TIGR01509 family)
MKIAAFDFDGTLVSTFPMITKCFLEVFKEEGVPMTEEGMNHLWGPSDLGICLKAFGPEEGVKAHQRYVELYEKYHPEMVKDLTPGVRPILEELKQKGVTMILVSGRAKVTTDFSFSFLRLNGYFAAEYFGSETGVNKPESLKKAQADFHVSPSDLVYVGDSVADIRSCQEAGVPLISVSYNHTVDVARLEKKNPGKVAHTPEELRTLLFKELDL